MIYKQTGIKDFGGRELKDFTWWIHGVKYDWQNAKAYIEIYARETHFNHNRTFEFDVPEEWTTQSVIDAVLSLACFHGSTVIEE